MERSNYALISALYSDKSRGLYSDIYFPIIKYVIVKISAELKSADKYSNAETVHNKIQELFDIKIPHVVIAKTVSKLANVRNGSIELEAYEDGNCFKIKRAYFDEEESTYEERERSFNLHLRDIEAEYKGFIEREGTCDEDATFMEFISNNTENILGYFENETEEQVEEKYTSMVFFLDYLHKSNEPLYKVANQLFWSSVIVAFLQSERPQVYDQERGCEAEYYLDTSIAMGLLELSTPENEASARDVSDIIKSSGGLLKIHPATLEEIKTILASVAQNGAYPGTSIANACARRNLETHDILKIQLNLQKHVESKGMVPFPSATVDIRKEILNKYKGKEVIRKLAENRNNLNGESSLSYANADMFREAHDVFMDDYICDRRKKSGKKNIFFLTTNTDLIAYCKKLHPDENAMISTSKVILDLWMHNAKPAHVSSSVLTETMARCLDMHRAKVRSKLHEVARLFNKTKEDVAPEVYQEFLKLLYRRARNVVNAVNEIPDDSKVFMAQLQDAIKEDNAYFNAVNSEVQSRNVALEEEVTKQTEKVQSLAEESELKSQSIGSLKTKNETLTQEKSKLIAELNLTASLLQEEKHTSEEERQAKRLAEFKNRIFEKREALENRRDELLEELKPWKEKRFDSFSISEYLRYIIVCVVMCCPALLYYLAVKYVDIKLDEMPGFLWALFGIASAVGAAIFFYFSEKRREARRAAAYAKWENKPENAEYKRLVSEIEELDAKIATCKGILKDPTSYMGEMG